MDLLKLLLLRRAALGALLTLTSAAKAGALVPAQRLNALWLTVVAAEP